MPAHTPLTYFTYGPLSHTIPCKDHSLQLPCVPRFSATLHCSTLHSVILDNSSLPGCTPLLLACCLLAARSLLTVFSRRLIASGLYSASGSLSYALRSLWSSPDVSSPGLHPASAGISACCWISASCLRPRSYRSRPALHLCQPTNVLPSLC